MACSLVLIQCSLSIDISWESSTNIAVIMFVYGFPYILAIPAIWEITIKNAANNYEKYGRI